MGLKPPGRKGGTGDKGPLEEGFWRAIWERGRSGRTEGAKGQEGGRRGRREGEGRRWKERKEVSV